MNSRAIKKGSFLRSVGSGVLFVLMLLVAPSLLYAEIGDVVWYQTYEYPIFETDAGDTINYMGQSIAVTEDGGCILVGDLANTTNNRYKAFLIKTDADGDTVWFRYYGPDDNYMYLGCKVLAESDGGCIMAGYKKVNGIASPNSPIGAFLVKYDSNGDTVWSNYYNESETHFYQYYQINDFCKTNDGGYALFGTTYRGTTVYYLEGFIIETDSDGRELHTYHYPAPVVEGAARVHRIILSGKQTDDGGYVLGGAVQSVFDVEGTNFIYNNGLLMKVDAAGDSVWEYHYGEHDQFFDFCETSDGGYIISDLNRDLRQPENPTMASLIDGFTGLKLDEYRNESWNVDAYYECGLATDTSIAGFAVHEIPNVNKYVFAGSKTWTGCTNDDPEIWPESHPFLGLYDADGNGTLRVYDTEFGTAEEMPIVALDIQVKRNGNYLVGGYVNAHRSFIYGIYLRPIMAFIAEIEGVPTSIDDDKNIGLPEQVSLLQNYPNPFNPTTSIQFALNQSDDVTLSIYDILGRKVNTLYTGTLAAGNHSITWNGTDESGDVVGSGVYFYRLETSVNTISKQMLLLK